MENEFKDTEIGKIPVDWEVSTFSEVIDVNPKRTLKKGEKYKKIAMTDIKEYNRKIQSYSIEEYKGGSRFTNDDTLFARITPCLENGKTAFVDILKENEIAFGSTEFIVLCGKEGITDSKYVYYLAISPEIRTKAIKAMIGTSGRQRVPNEVFNSIHIPLPPLPEQNKIAEILSTLDDKIENNNQQNKILEETANSIFKEWFVNFNFLNEDGLPYFENGGEMEFNEELGIEIPKGWKVCKLRDVVEYYIGGGWGKEEKEDDFPKEAFVIRGTDIPNARYGDIKEIPLRYHKTSNYESRMIKPLDIVLEVSGGSKGQPVGRSLMILPEVLSQLDNKLICASFCKLMRLKEVISPYYIDLLIKDLYSTEKIMLYQQQSTGISNFKFEFFLDDVIVVLPDEKIKEHFNKILKDIYSKIGQNGIQSQILAKKRDLLLPKLMSGEIRLK